MLCVLSGYVTVTVVRSALFRLKCSGSALLPVWSLLMVFCWLCLSLFVVIMITVLMVCWLLFDWVSAMVS